MTNHNLRSESFLGCIFTEVFHSSNYKRNIKCLLGTYYMQEGIVLENEGNAKSMPGVGVKLVGPGVRLLESPSSAT